MKVTSYAVARPAYYDRGAASINKAYGASGIAPHVNTTRFTYTVPAGRKCVVENICVSIYREGVASPIGQVFGYVVLFDGSTYCNLVNLYTAANTVGATSTNIVGNGATVYAGEQIIGGTWDLGTGGTNDFRLNAKGTEYNA
jgi:hypothetical protein